MGFARDLRDNIDVANSLLPALSTGSRTGSGVDLQGYDSAVAVFHIGAWTGGTHTPSLQDSTDNTTFADVAASNLNGAFTAVTGTGGTAVGQRVGYIGGKRYLRVFSTAGNATDVMASGAVIIRGHASRRPLA
jgi:hypothetical protein